MRLQANFEMDTNWLIKDYRRLFMSLIKNIFSTYDPMLYVRLYGTEDQKQKVNKPFTFSVHFPGFKKIEGGKVFCGSKVGLFFSSNDEILVAAFYNGLKRNKQIMIGENNPIKFTVTNIQLLPLKKINSNKVEFKTISPVLVNQLGNNLNFIPPTHPDFDNAFKEIISNQANELGVRCIPKDIQFEIDYENVRKLPLSHYNQTMTSWLGKFIMEAPKNVLQLVYDTGIGVRRSQGFGMLEIEKYY